MAFGDGHLEIRSDGPAGYSTKIFLDGVELTWVVSCDIHMSATELNSVTLKIVPGSITVDLPDGTTKIVKLYDDPSQDPEPSEAP